MADADLLSPKPDQPIFDRKLLSIPVGRKVARSGGKRPALVYSVVRLKLTEISNAYYKEPRQSHDRIGEMIGVSGDTVKRALEFVIEPAVGVTIERAWNEKKEELWREVEDHLFREFPGFRSQPFYKQMLSDIAAGRLARNVGKKRGPKRRRGIHASTDADAGQGADQANQPSVTGGAAITKRPARSALAEWNDRQDAGAGLSPHLSRAGGS